MLTRILIIFFLLLQACSQQAFWARPEGAHEYPQASAEWLADTRTSEFFRSLTYEEKRKLLNPAQELRVYSGSIITVAPESRVDYGQTLFSIADLAGLNFAAKVPEKGYSLSPLIDVPWDQALKAIAESNGQSFYTDCRGIAITDRSQVRASIKARKNDFLKLCKPVRNKVAASCTLEGLKNHASDIYCSQVYSGPPINLNFVNKDLKEVLLIIGEKHNINFVFYPGVAGKITGRFSNLAWDEALDLILKTNQLELRPDGAIMHIAPEGSFAPV